jgi:hypothetical protein
MTDITIILDRSGSMESVVDDTIGGFNHFLEDQKSEPGEAVISLVQFDDQYEPVYRARLLADAPPLDRTTFVPRGSTALVDAIGRTIQETGARLAAMLEEDRPEKVLVMILTDGYENASRHYSMQKVSEMIAHQRDVYRWEFVFLAANQDAIATAAGYGIAPDAALTFAASPAGTAAAFKSSSDRTKEYRGRRAQAARQAFFIEEDREKQEDELKK